MHRLIRLAMASLLGLLIAAAPGGREVAAQRTRQANVSPAEENEIAKLVREFRRDLRKYLDLRDPLAGRRIYHGSHYRLFEDPIIDPDPRIGLPDELIRIMGGDGAGADAD